MKILWFTNGPGLALEYLTRNKSNRSWSAALNIELADLVELHVAFYYPKYTEPFVYKNTKFYPICKKNWKVHFLKNIFFKKNIDEEDIYIYKSLIKQIEPDIIHIHGTENPFGCIIKETSVPVVISIQGILNAIIKNYFSGIPKKYLNVRGSDFNLRSFLFSSSFKTQYLSMIRSAIREEKNLYACRYIIGRTDWDKYYTSILAPKSKYFGNDHRILDEIYYSSKWSYPNTGNGFVIHVTISNNYYKGFEIICEALYHLINIGFNVTLQVAGIKKSNSLYVIVKKMMKNKFPESNIVALGDLNSKQLVDNLCKAHLFVMPSHIENNSNSLCEAMKIGVPCIASYVGGIGSLIVNDFDGVLVQNGDSIALAGAIKELLLNKEKLIKISQNAIKSSNKRHDKEKIINNLLSIYNCIINDVSNNEKNK